MLGDSCRHDGVDGIGALRAAKDQIEAHRFERLRKQVGGRHRVAAADRGIGDQRRVVRSHAERFAHDVDAALRSHRHDGDRRIAAYGLFEPQRFLDRVLVERVEHVLDAGAIEALGGGIEAFFRVGIRYLFDRHNDLHAYSFREKRRFRSRPAAPAMRGRPSSPYAARLNMTLPRKKVSGLRSTTMQNKDVIVTDSTTTPSAPWGVIAAIIVIALAIALFVCQPWNATSRTSNTTTNTSVTQPNNGANNANAGSGTTGTSGTSGGSGGSNTNP